MHVIVSVFVSAPVFVSYWYLVLYLYWNLYQCLYLLYLYIHLYFSLYLYLKGQQSSWHTLTLSGGLSATFKTWLRCYTLHSSSTTQHFAPLSVHDLAQQCTLAAPRAPPPPLSSEPATILPCTHRNIINLVPPKSLILV